MYNKIVCVAFQIGLGRSLRPVFIAMDGRRDASPSFKEPVIRRSIVAALTWPRRGVSECRCAHSYCHGASSSERSRATCDVHPFVLQFRAACMSSLPGCNIARSLVPTPQECNWRLLAAT